MIIKLLRKLRFNPHSSTLGSFIHYLTLKRVSRLSVYRFEHQFNNKIVKLIQRICKHEKTYESNYWSGGYTMCADCHKTLKTNWLPIRVEPK